jgi:flagellar basal-body rod protein FlgB
MIALKGGNILGLLNSVSFQRLQGGIDAANKRQSVLANNVANVDTPNFKRSDVSFESFLKQQESGIKSTMSAKVSNSRHIQFGNNTVVPAAVVNTDKATSMNNNDNNVDVDREMALSAENQLRYSSYVEQVNSQISMMRAVIQGG